MPTRGIEEDDPFGAQAHEVFPVLCETAKSPLRFDRSHDVSAPRLDLVNPARQFQDPQPARVSLDTRYSAYRARRVSLSHDRPADLAVCRVDDVDGFPTGPAVVDGIENSVVRGEIRYDFRRTKTLQGRSPLVQLEDHLALLEEKSSVDESDAVRAVA